MSGALVTLGAAVWANERASPTLSRRINCAASLWRVDPSLKIIVSGGVGHHPPSEAEMMRRLLCKQGVPASSIILEDRSTNTLENAIFSAALMREHGLTHAIIVTDGYHMARAWLSFRHAGVVVSMVSASRCQPRPRLALSMRQWLREALALPFYALRLLLRRIHH